MIRRASNCPYYGKRIQATEVCARLHTWSQFNQEAPIPNFCYPQSTKPTYEGNPQFIIKIVDSCVVDIKIITPKYFRLLFFRHHQGTKVLGSNNFYVNNARIKNFNYKLWITLIICVFHVMCW